jgi:hypothetical protein
LPEIFEVQRRYHIEEAGNHTDGTPLLAVYSSEPEVDDQASDFPE